MVTGGRTWWWGHGAPAGLSLLRNTGAPGNVAFEAGGVHLPLTAALAELAVADLDRDGKPDVVAAVPEPGGVWVWRNTAYVGAFSATQPATLASPQWFGTEPGARAVAVAEMDGDGFPEVAVVHLGRGSLTLLGNRSQPGQLELVPRGHFAAGDGPLAVALGDLNGDRRPDVAVADHLGGRFQVRQNRSTHTGGGAVPFTIGNIRRPATELKVTVRSANPGLLPAEGLVLGGEGNNRMLQLTPAPGVSGVARVTVRVENGAQGWVENELLVLVGCPDNTVWPMACELGWEPDAEGVWRASIHQALGASGEGRWFKFKIQPESELFIILSELSRDYDLFVFQDIRAAYEAIEAGDLGVDDLAGLGTRYAPAAYSPAAYSGEAYAPVAYSPAAYSPAAYSPAAYSPAAYSPAAYSPAAYSPAAYSPAAYSPAAYSEDAFAPAAYSPAAYSGPAEAPVAFSPAAYSGAQTRSLVAVSAFDGLANEGIFMNTWGAAVISMFACGGVKGCLIRSSPSGWTCTWCPGTAVRWT
ncbi:MAG: FG-GAP-like repeat-containing protein [Verrucomicrobia bacterium]|nr:FG-GAP-like repeat-containing protein [Verrucomicrobiota bacterium]